MYNYELNKYFSKLADVAEKQREKRKLEGKPEPVISIVKEVPCTCKENNSSIQKATKPTVITPPPIYEKIEKEASGYWSQEDEEEYDYFDEDEDGESEEDDESEEDEEYDEDCESEEDEEYVDESEKKEKESSEDEESPNNKKASNFLQKEPKLCSTSNPTENSLENKKDYVEYEDPKDIVDPNYVTYIFNYLNTFTKKEIIEALKKASLPSQGSKKQLKKLLRNFYRAKYVENYRKAEASIRWDREFNKTLQFFDYLVVIDFECTCEEVIYDYPHEIIEFPAVLIDVRQMKIVDQFRTFIKPVIVPKLSEFCIDFCNLSQEKVDQALTFQEAFNEFNLWMADKHKLGQKGRRYCFVTDGPHDIWKFLQFQCMNSNLREVPHNFRYWCNIQKIFETSVGHKLIKGAGPTPKTRLTSLHQMLAHYGLEEEGTAHTGIDDSRNIAKVVINLMRLDRAEIRINERMCYTEDPFFKRSKNPDEVTQGTSDIHIWREKLPLKWRRVQREEFISESYFDCETCDEDD